MNPNDFRHLLPHLVRAAEPVREFIGWCHQSAERDSKDRQDLIAVYESLKRGVIPEEVKRARQEAVARDAKAEELDRKMGEAERAVEVAKKSLDVARESGDRKAQQKAVDRYETARIRLTELRCIEAEFEDKAERHAWIKPALGIARRLAKYGKELAADEIEEAIEGIDYDANDRRGAYLVAAEQVYEILTQVAGEHGVSVEEKLTSLPRCPSGHGGEATDGEPKHKTGGSRGNGGRPPEWNDFYEFAVEYREQNSNSTWEDTVNEYKKKYTRRAAPTPARACQIYCEYRKRKQNPK